MIRLLQRQGFIEHKPTSASEAAHQQRLLPVGYQFKLVSLQALHDGSLYCVLHHDAIGHVYPGPEVTGFSGLEEVDILPALKDGDSYGVLQDIHLEESFRWVPASSEMHALPLRAWHG